MGPIGPDISDFSAHMFVNNFDNKYKQAYFKILETEEEEDHYQEVPLEELKGYIHYTLFAKLANGVIKDAEFNPSSELLGIKVRGDMYEIGIHYLKDFGIQVLRKTEK